MEAVASRAQIDVSTLSRLESGKRRLALDHVPALAAALGVSTDDLLTRARQDPRVRERPRTRDGLTMWPLTRHGPAHGLQAYKFRISAARREPPAELPTHEGHDWIYVLTGRMRLMLGDGRSHHQAGRGGRVQHLDAALVRRASTARLR